MTDSISHEQIPSFVFICGAVGSGNTFMFRCLSQDPDNYALNEVDLGRFLDRLIRSEKLTGRCPHSLEAYLEFLQALKGDKRTLLEKNPANIRYRQQIRKHVPNSRFIAMLREPHAAIVSGLDGRSILNSPEHVARLWLSDYEHVIQSASDSIVVVYDEFISDPTTTLNAIAQRIVPVSSAVHEFASRVNRPERSNPERWKEKVNAETATEIQHWVKELNLGERYRDTLSQNDSGLLASATGAVWNGAPSTFTMAKKLFFQAWYRLRK